MDSERQALENIKRLLINGKFELHGIECLAFAKAFKTLDELIERYKAPASAGVLSSAIQEPKRGKRGDKNLGRT